MFRKLLLTITLILTAAVCSGCLSCLFLSGGDDRSKPFTKLYSDSEVVAARYYIKNDDGEYEITEMDSARVAAFAAELDGLEYTKHSWHTDYFWQGWYGVELELADGNCIHYDYGEYALTPLPIRDGFDRKKSIKRTYVDVDQKAFHAILEKYIDLGDDDRGM